MRVWLTFRPRRRHPWTYLAVVCGTLGGAVAASCASTSSVAADHWAVAEEFLDGALGGALHQNDGEWSRAFVPLSQQVILGLEENLEACPEGSVAVLLHALPALEEKAGDAVSFEVVKHLHHLLGNAAASAAAAATASASTSAWRRHWLGAVASLLRYVYFKWVNVPQGAAHEEPTVRRGGVTVNDDTLQRHHALVFKSSVDDFIRGGALDIAIAENSVLFSEAFAFVSFCRFHGVDLVLESGVYKGFSTEVWSLYVRKVVAVDLFPSDEVMHAANARLQPRRNARVVRGNGKMVLPQLLEERPGLRTAIFIDGPKGELAIHLALRLRQYPQVAFVAIHDMAPYRASLMQHGAFFFSDEPWFQAKYGHLDAGFRARPDLEAGGTMAFLSKDHAAS